MDTLQEKQIYTRKKILLASRRLFFGVGFSKITMDEIAEELNMSKRTIYQLFKSKDFLLKAVIKDFFQEFQNKLNQITTNQNTQGLGTLKMFIGLIQEQLAIFNIYAFKDISKSNPEAWQKIKNLREKTINKKLEELIFKAKKEGAIRQDIDINILVLLILNTIQTVINPETIAQLPYSTDEVVNMMSKFIISGLIKDDSDLMIN
ncbi:MAG: TetR/AcrR family transcriptional regulator [Atribacterota bacterium]|nr:TetR/AcrR family transcriptional regulator [Atribacterota bacterium]